MDLQEIFRRMCLIRYFEYQVAEAYQQKLCHAPIYLGVGQEACAGTVSTLTGGFTVFAQHRGHDAYLAHGGDPEQLRDELIGLDTGCNRGRGGSACVADINIPMYSHQGFIGDNVPLAAGYALGSGNPTLVYVGDAGVEEDYALAGFGFAASKSLPILFVCEDNDLSILTPISDRRNWEIHNVTAGMGMASASIVDDPVTIYNTVQDLLTQLPAFVNIKTCRHLWHAGVGNDGPPAWDRLAELRETVDGAAEIERKTQHYVENLWQEQLQKQ